MAVDVTADIDGQWHACNVGWIGLNIDTQGSGAASKTSRPDAQLVDLLQQLLLQYPDMLFF